MTVKSTPRQTVVSVIFGKEGPIKSPTFPKESGEPDLSDIGA